MNNKELYEKYISKLEQAIIIENFGDIDYILEFIFSIGLEEKILEKIENILNEATLFLEFKDDEYKQEVLKLIEIFKS